MATQVSIVSREAVRPSLPTPDHLRTHKLSFLDQLHPTIFSHVALYYLADNSNDGKLNISESLNHLKESLSKTLTRFYPLAGRIAEDQLSIDCNDEGLHYFEARVNCFLANFLTKPDLNLLNQFYPCHPSNIEPCARIYPVMIQINIFDCSSIVIGLCLSHKILDGISTSTFLKGWAACARGCIEATRPVFRAASLFPPSNNLPMDAIALLGRSMVKTGNCITRRFLFDSSSMAALKSRASGRSGIQNPSRVEAVSAFIWKSAMSALEANAGHQKPSIISHAVDLRRRMELPLEEHMGNLLWIPYAQWLPEEDKELKYLIRKIRETITSIDGDFVGKLQSGEGSSIVSENVKAMTELCSKGPVEYYGFTSWSKFGMYETEFGWGKPTWVSSHRITGPVFMNLVHMVETKRGDGIEAWITLDERDMAALLGDQEFLKFASVDPALFPRGTAEAK
ncbi:Vinorine synthase [Bertholletia excelsa]